MWEGWSSMAELFSDKTQTCQSFPPNEEWYLWYLGMGYIPAPLPSLCGLQRCLWGCGVRSKTESPLLLPCSDYSALEALLSGSCIFCTCDGAAVGPSLQLETVLFLSMQWKAVTQPWYVRDTKPVVKGIQCYFILDPWKLPSSLVIVMGMSISEHL